MVQIVPRLVGWLDCQLVTEDCQLVTELHGLENAFWGGKKGWGLKWKVWKYTGQMISVCNDGCFGNLFFPDFFRDDCPLCMFFGF